MSNGSEACCILQICCVPAAAREALIREMIQVSGYDRDGCEKIADYIGERFALAPKSFETVVHNIVHFSKTYGSGG